MKEIQTNQKKRRRNNNPPYYSGLETYCRITFGMSINYMMSLPIKTKDQQEFLDYALDKKARMKEFKKALEGNFPEEDKQWFERYLSKKEDLTETQAWWHERNPEASRMRGQKRIAMKNNLAATFTKEEWEETKKYFNYCCCYCGEPKLLQQEHFIPVSKEGEYVLGNILPACKSCNSNKRAKLFSEWYPNSYQYDKKREQKINDFIKNFSQQYK